MQEKKTSAYTKGQSEEEQEGALDKHCKVLYAERDCAQKVGVGKCLEGQKGSTSMRTESYHCLGN